MDPSLQDYVLIPDNFFEYVYHVECNFKMHSIIATGLIAGGNSAGRDHQKVFFHRCRPYEHALFLRRKNSI